MSEIISLIPGALYVTSGNRSALISINNGLVSPTQEKYDQKITFPFVPWGNNNKLPYEMAEIIKKVPELSSMLRRAGRMICGNGIRYLVKAKTATNQVVWEPGEISLIDDFLDENDIDGMILQIATQYFYYENNWVGCMLSRDRKEIKRVWSETTENCRTGWQDDNGYINDLFINANWKSSIDIKKGLEVPLVDIQFDTIKQIERLKGLRFAMPLNYYHASPDDLFYGTPSWYSAVVSDWVDFALSIPRFKKAMMKNQISPKYHIKIDDRYWNMVYGESFAGFSEQKKKEIMMKEVTDFQNNMGDVNNANNTLITHKVQTGEKYESMWEVEVIDDKVKQGIYIEDSQEATIKIVNASGLHTALFGGISGKGHSAGSGSDINAAYNVFNIEHQVTRKMCLRPLNITKMFNNKFSRFKDLWNIKWDIDVPMMMRMDAGQPKPTTEAA